MTQHKLKRSKAPMGRYFSPEIFQDTEFLLAERKYQTGWGALRLMHLGVMANADAYGRFEWDESHLYLQIGARLHKVKFRRLLNILQNGDSKGKVWLCRYNEQGEYDPQGCYGHVRTWAKWQHVHEREGARVLVPCPCEIAIVCNEADTVKKTSREIGVSPQVPKPIEGKVFLKAVLPGWPKERVVLHNGMIHRVAERPDLVTDWDGLEPETK